MKLDEAKKILKDEGFLLEYITKEEISPEKDELIEEILDNPLCDSDLDYYTLAGWSIDDLENYKNELNDLHNEERYVNDPFGMDETFKTLKKAGYIVEGSMSLKDKISNAKQFNVGIDEMKKDAVNIFKQAFYDEEVTDNGDGTYTIVPDSDYDIKAIYKWDDNDTFTCKYNYSDNVLTFKHLSKHLNYDPKGGPWGEGIWKGDEELENFLTDLSFEYQNAMSV